MFQRLGDGHAVRRDQADVAAVFFEAGEIKIFGIVDAAVLLLRRIQNLKRIVDARMS